MKADFPLIVRANAFRLLRDRHDGRFDPVP